MNKTVSHPNTFFYRTLIHILLIVLPGIGILQAQDSVKPETKWTFTSRFTVGGLSDRSDPPGYKVYSSMVFTAGLRYRIVSPISAEFILSTESREVDLINSENREISLGSIDYLAFVLVLQYHLPLEGRFHPYAGIGLNFNRYFEKSGVVNELGVPNSAGMTAQLGADVDLSSYMIFNIDIRANKMEIRLVDNGQELTRIKTDPASFSLGLGFRF